jgi:hypothetical protein
MSLHHRWSNRLECCACHTVGEVRVSEYAGPPFRLVGVREYTFTGGFQRHLGLADGLPDQFECSACGAQAPATLQS